MKRDTAYRHAVAAGVCVTLSISLLALAGCGRLRRTSSTQGAHHIVSGGIDRTYRVHAPASEPGPQGYPLVLAYHGHGGDSEGQARLSSMNQTADTNGFVVAYPDGVNGAWNDGRAAQAGADIDDVGFTRDLISELEKDYSIDASRVYATGMSNGGMMCYRLAVDLPDKITAIAPVAALMSEDLAARGAATPMPVMITAGTDDPLMPYSGGSVGLFLKMRGDVLSAQATTALWVKADGCATTPTTTRLDDKDPSDGTTVRVDDYKGGRDNTEVLLYTVDGGGHTWPGGWQYLRPRIVGATSRDYNASQAIWDFFNRH